MDWDGFTIEPARSESSPMNFSNRFYRQPPNTYGKFNDMPRAKEKTAETRFPKNIRVCHDVAHLCCLFAIGEWHVKDNGIITL